jgi:hypothetical protein
MTCHELPVTVAANSLGLVGIPQLAAEALLADTLLASGALGAPRDPRELRIALRTHIVIHPWTWHNLQSPSNQLHTLKMFNRLERRWEGLLPVARLLDDRPDVVHPFVFLLAARRAQLDASLVSFGIAAPHVKRILALQIIPLAHLEITDEIE